MPPSVARKQPLSQVKLRFGPADHGRHVNDREIETADYVAGFKYEIIAGRLYVSPQPNIPENRLEHWLRRAIERYSDVHPEVINSITPKGRVYLPEAVRLTVPEPDIAAYANFPLEWADEDETTWEDVSPIVVVEILVESEIEKDLGRNPGLYLAVPSIREYWVVDGSINPREPSLIQHVRRGKKWTITTHAFGSTFTPKVLPGFSLAIDPRKR
jgi:Uma2 family endonuclease